MRASYELTLIGWAGRELNGFKRVLKGSATTAHIWEVLVRRMYHRTWRNTVIFHEHHLAAHHKTKTGIPPDHVDAFA
eukprot:8827133-Pyramimonas_sp.AAC.1